MSDLNDPAKANEPDQATFEASEVADRTKICPTCSYSTAGPEFQVCPRCGLIIRKYYGNKRRMELGAVSDGGACGICGSALDSESAVCPKCEEPEASNKSTSIAGKVVIVAACTAMGILFGVMYSKRTLPPRSSILAVKGTSPKAASSSHAVDAGARTDVAGASAAYAPQDKPSRTSPPSSEGLSNAIPNSLGIMKAKVVFSSGMDRNNMPVNDLNRISINERMIVCHVKMVISPEKSYQFSGRLYDGEGKLVMNITGPSSPAVARWFAWYYHDFDRSVDKPGRWRFLFLVNGEPIAEQRVDVTE